MTLSYTFAISLMLLTAIWTFNFLQRGDCYFNFQETSFQAITRELHHSPSIVKRPFLCCRRLGLLSRQQDLFKASLPFQKLELSLQLKGAVSNEKPR